VPRRDLRYCRRMGLKVLVAAVFAVAWLPGAASADRDLGTLDAVVASRGLAPVPDGWPIAIVTRTGVVVVADGASAKSIVSVVDGDVDPQDKEGGVLGMYIPRLGAYASSLVASKPSLDGFLITADQEAPYRVIVEIAFSLTKASVKRLALLCKGKTGLGIIPVALADKQANVRDPKRGLQLVVSMTRDKLQLWSLSGHEGTAAKPKLAVARGELAALTTALADIAKRRFGAKRSASDRRIVVTIDLAFRLKEVVDLLVAIRTAADGTELFPDVVLALGNG